jgi:hypothetical protein
LNILEEPFNVIKVILTQLDLHLASNPFFQLLKLLRSHILVLGKILPPGHLPPRPHCRKRPARELVGAKRPQFVLEDHVPGGEVGGEAVLLNINI